MQPGLEKVAWACLMKLGGFSCPFGATGFLVPPGLHQLCPSCHRTHPTHTSVSNCLLLPWWGGLPPHSTGTWGGKNNWFGVTFFLFIRDSPIRACDSHSLYTRVFASYSSKAKPNIFYNTRLPLTPLSKNVEITWAHQKYPRGYAGTSPKFTGL